MYIKVQVILHERYVYPFLLGHAPHFLVYSVFMLSTIYFILEATKPNVREGVMYQKYQHLFRPPFPKVEKNIVHGTIRPNSLLMGNRFYREGEGEMLGEERREGKREEKAVD
ncbi:hypothetical protein GJ744_004587 [Endocarpon pusillum]|uniref:Uncharacterized protein n=1 Tax=Endocarpon pusillum TaxID=364733 RepID=A0A8H7ALS7_9EURO|nr:hypothetical protein GJ744_004587 [Endocarpon pusillum]